MTENKSLRYAGFWARFGAVTIDMICVMPLYVALLWLDVPTHWIDILGFAVVCSMYLVALSSRFQASLGMYLMRVKAVNLRGEPLSIWDVLRWILASIIMMTIAMGGMLYLYFSYDIEAIMQAVKRQDMYEVQALAGMSFFQFYGWLMLSFVWSLVVFIIWSLTVALGKQKAGLHNWACGIRFIKDEPVRD